MIGFWKTLTRTAKRQPPGGSGVSFLLDTDRLSAHLRRPSGLAHRFFQYSGPLYTSTIALAELYAWAYRRPDPSPALDSVEKMLFHEARLTVRTFNECTGRFSAWVVA